MIAWAKRREILIGGVIIAVLFLAAAWARADGPGWSAWYSTAGLKSVTGITFSTDSGHVVGDLPVIDKVPFGPLEFVKRARLDYDLLLGVRDDETFVVGAGISANLGDEFITVKVGVGVMTGGGAGLYLGVGLKL